MSSPSFSRPFVPTLGSEILCFAVRQQMHGYIIRPCIAPVIYCSSEVSQRYEIMAEWQNVVFLQMERETLDSTLSLNGFNIVYVATWITSSLMSLAFLCMLAGTKSCRGITGVPSSDSLVTHLPCISGLSAVVVVDIGSRSTKACPWSFKYRENWRLKFKKHYMDGIGNIGTGLKSCGSFVRVKLYPTSEKVIFLMKIFILYNGCVWRA